MFENRVSRRQILGYLAVSLSAGAFGIACQETGDKDGNFLGVDNDVLFIRLSANGINLDLYKGPKKAEENKFQIEAGKDSARFERFSVDFPEIFKGEGEEKWIKLESFVKSRGKWEDAYIPFEQSTYVIIPRDGQMVPLDRKGGSYINPFNGRVIPSGRIGAMDPLSDQQIEDLRIFQE